MPGSRRSNSAGSDVWGNRRAEFHFPSMDRIIACIDPVISQHILHIPKTRRKAKAEPDSTIDHCDWEAVAGIGNLFIPCRYLGFTTLVNLPWQCLADNMLSARLGKSYCSAGRNAHWTYHIRRYFKFRALLFKSWISESTSGPSRSQNQDPSVPIVIVYNACTILGTCWRNERNDVSLEHITFIVRRNIRQSSTRIKLRPICFESSEACDPNTVVWRQIRTGGTHEVGDQIAEIKTLYFPKLGSCERSIVISARLVTDCKSLTIGRTRRSSSVLLKEVLASNSTKKSLLTDSIFQKTEPYADS